MNCWKRAICGVLAFCFTTISAIPGWAQFQPLQSQPGVLIEASAQLSDQKRYLEALSVLDEVERLALEDFKRLRESEKQYQILNPGEPEDGAAVGTFVPPQIADPRNRPNLNRPGQNESEFLPLQSNFSQFVTEDMERPFLQTLDQVRNEIVKRASTEGITIQEADIPQFEMVAAQLDLGDINSPSSGNNPNQISPLNPPSPGTTSAPTTSPSAFPALSFNYRYAQALKNLLLVDQGGRRTSNLWELPGIAGMTGYYPGGISGGIGGRNGTQEFDMGVAARFIYYSPLLYTDFDLQAVRLQREFSALTVGQLADLTLNRMVFFTTLSAVFAPWVGRYGARSATLTGDPGNPRIPGGPGGGFPPQGQLNGFLPGQADQNMLNQISKNPQNVLGRMTSYVREGSSGLFNYVKNATKHAADIGPVLLLYASAYLTLAALYDIQIASVEHGLAFAILMGYASLHVRLQGKISDEAMDSIRRQTIMDVDYLRAMSANPSRAQLERARRHLEKVEGIHGTQTWTRDQIQTTVAQVARERFPNNPVLKLMADDVERYWNEVDDQGLQRIEETRRSVDQIFGDDQGRPVLLEDIVIPPQGADDIAKNPTPFQPNQPGAQPIGFPNQPGRPGWTVPGQQPTMGPNLPPIGQPNPPTGPSLPPIGQPNPPTVPGNPGTPGSPGTPNPPNRPEVPRRKIPGAGLNVFELAILAIEPALTVATRYAQSKTLAFAMKKWFEDQYEDRRHNENIEFHTFLFSTEAPIFFKLLTMAINNGLERPQILDIDAIELEERDNFEDENLKKQLLFVKNIARSAKYCPALADNATELEQKKQDLMQKMTSHFDERDRLLSEVLPNGCSIKQNTDLGIWGKVKGFFHQLDTWILGDKCKPKEDSLSLRRLHDAQAHWNEGLDLRITLTMCSDLQNSARYERLKREFRYLNGFEFNRDQLVVLQSRPFYLRLRMLELVIQLQNLDQDFSEADSRFLTNFVLPVLGLDKVINGMYASRYQSYLATNGWLDYNIESPTGFKVNNLADKLYQVYNYDNAEKVLDAPTRKYVDYINDPYPAQNWGSNYGTSYGRSPIFGGFGFQ